MKLASPSLPACVIVIVSCLAWVAGISWLLFYFLQLTPMVGWLLAAALGFATTVAATIILYELRHAIDLADYVQVNEFDGLLGAPWKMPLPAPVVTGPARGFRAVFAEPL